MILQSLVEYYEQLVKNQKIGAPGWGNAKVSFAVTIDAQGNYKSISPIMREETRNNKTVLVPTIISVPSHPTRSGKMPPPYFLCDNAKYLLGVWQETGNPEEDTASKEKAELYFNNAASYHRGILEKSDSIEAKSLIKFFSKWDFNEQKELLSCSVDDLLKANNIIFRLENTGKFIHECPEIIKLWNEEQSNHSDETVGQCLITGKKNVPIARLHPLIKGIPGAQSSGAALVSFNAPAFESYGKEQGANAPVSVYAANAYGAALNYLLSLPEHYKIMGHTTIVYWAETAEDQYAQYFSEFLIGGDKEDKYKLYDVMSSIANGKEVEYQDQLMKPKTKFYILGLSPNAARLSVRFFYSNTYGEMLNNVKQHYQRMALLRAQSDMDEKVSLGRILYETANRNAKDKSAPSVLIGNLFNSVLNNTRYPEAIFSTIMLRIRADRDVNYYRISFIKAYLIKNKKEIGEEVGSMKLNTDTTYTPYLLGRLFSILEQIQSSASGGELNTTIVDKYLNSAAATPAIIFPQLLKLSNSHLKVLRREKKGLAKTLSEQLTEISSLMRETFPSFLSLEDQGTFMLGYYQQTQKRFEKKEKDKKDKDGIEKDNCDNVNNVDDNMEE